jgi:hypothetical protein
VSGTGATPKLKKNKTMVGMRETPMEMRGLDIVYSYEAKVMGSEQVILRDPNEDRNSQTSLSSAKVSCRPIRM